MATNTITPEMGLTNPTPQQEPGPAYAADISNDLVIIDGHDHTNGKGVLITPQALNLNSDLTFNSNNATGLRSTRLISNNSTIGGVGDLNCVYDVSGDLWFNNGIGTPVRITSGSNVYAPSATSTWSTANTTTNYVIAAIDTAIVIACDSTSNTINVTLPANSLVSEGRFYIIKDVKGTSQTYNITVLTTGFDTIDISSSSLVIDDNFWSVGFIADHVGNWRVIKFNKYSYLSGETLNINSGAALDIAGTLSVTGTITAGTASTVSLNGISAINGIFASNCYFISSATPYTVSIVPTVSPTCLFCTTLIGTNTINLPAAASAPPGMILVVKDYTGTAQTHGISIVPSGADTIEAIAATYLLATNFGSVTLINAYPNVSGWFLI